MCSSKQRVLLTRGESRRASIAEYAAGPIRKCANLCDLRDRSDPFGRRPGGPRASGEQAPATSVPLAAATSGRVSGLRGYRLEGADTTARGGDHCGGAGPRSALLRPGPRSLGASPRAPLRTRPPHRAAHHRHRSCCPGPPRPASSDGRGAGHECLLPSGPLLIPGRRRGSAAAHLLLAAASNGQRGLGRRDRRRASVNAISIRVGQLVQFGQARMSGPVRQQSGPSSLCGRNRAYRLERREMRAFR